MLRLHNHRNRFWAAAFCFLISTCNLAQDSLRSDDVTKLASDLLTAETQEDRDRLLDQNKLLVTVELRKALMLQANGFVRNSEYSKAYDVLRVTQAVTEKLGDRSGAAEVLRTTARVDHFLAEDQLAQERLRKAVSIFKELGDASGAGQSLMDIAAIEREQAKTAQALDTIQAALAQFALARNNSDLGAALEVMAGIYLDRGELDLASQVFERSLSQDNSASHYVKVASAFFQKEEYSRAAQYYQQALSEFEKGGDLPGYRDTLSRLAATYSEETNYDLAFQYQIRSLKIAQQSGDRESLAAEYMALAEIYMNRGNLSLAADSYRLSLKIAHDLGNKIGSGIRSSNLGVVLELQGDPTSALESYQSALTQFKDADFAKGAARVLSHIGKLYYGQGKDILALQAFQESLSFSKSEGSRLGTASALLDIGMVQASRGNYTEALAADQQALAELEPLGIKEETANALINIASLEAMMRKPEQALTSALRAASLAADSTNLSVLSLAWFQAGKNYQSLNRPYEARSAYKQAVDAIEARSRQNGSVAPAVNRNDAVPFDALMRLLIDAHQVSEAFAIAERGKAQFLRDVLQSGDAEIVKGETRHERETEKKLIHGLRQLGAKIDRQNRSDHPDLTSQLSLTARMRKARFEYSSFETTLYKSHPLLAAERGSRDPASIETINSTLLDANTALAEYVVTDELTYLFVLTRGRSSPSTAQGGGPLLRVYTIPITSAQLAREVVHFRELLEARDKDVDSRGRELYSILLGPARAQFDGKTKIVLVPDRQLWALPFAALKPSENRYLIEESAISYAQSSSSLCEMIIQSDKRAASGSNGSGMLALGNASLSNEMKAYLGSAQAIGNYSKTETEVEEELTNVGKVYGLPIVRTYNGSSATEERFRREAGSYRVLHFAAPSLVDEASPMFSSIALVATPGSNDESDGLLQPREILGLDLKAELVVMPSTSSQIRSGAGIVGMSGAWFIAGSPTLLINQWKQAFTATTALLTEFYSRIPERAAQQNRRISKAEALRMAMIKLLHDETYREPYYWSGFVLVGDGR